MAYDVGNVGVFRLDIENYDGTTVATVEVKAPDGAVTNLTPTSSNNGATWTVLVTLDQAGVWYIGWHVTGTGALTQWDQAEAEVPPPPTEAQDDVRLLIADTDPSIRMFSTRQIAAFLRLNSDNVRRAAAQALDTIAANEALVSKKITTQDLSTDGPAVAASLRAQAKELRRQADAGEGSTDEFGFEIVDFEPYPCRPGWPY